VSALTDIMKNYRWHTSNFTNAETYEIYLDNFVGLFVLLGGF